MTDEIYGIGLVGCGLIGRKRSLNLPASCKLVAIHDQDKGAAENLANQVSTRVDLKDSPVSLVSDPRVDVVIVATNHLGLADVAGLAVAHHKHVLIEKPGAITAEALEPVAKKAWDSGCLVRVGFNHRFHPSMLMAHDLINSKKYGDLLWIRGRYGHGGRLGYDREWRANKSLSGGGELLDQGSHLIDLTRYFCGDVTLAYSNLCTRFWEMEVEDNAFLALEPVSGGIAWLHASWTEWKNTFSLEITLRNAKIDIAGLGGSYGTESLTLYEMQPEMGPPPSQYYSWDSSDISWKLELEDLVSSIRGSESVGATAEDALATLRIIGKAYSQ